MGATQRICRLKPKWNIKSTNQNEIFPKKKCFSYLKSVKEPKIRMRATRRNLQARPKILKNEYFP
jgi:hypothetical protein